MKEGQKGPRKRSSCNGQEAGYLGQKMGHKRKETGGEAESTEKEKMYRSQEMRGLGKKVR